jgi:uncharacterized membrane protein
MKQEYPRPEILLVKKPIDIFFEMVALLTIFFMWGFCLYHYKSLPEIIPTHYGTNGIVDDYGSKKTIFLIPAIVTIIVFGMRWLNRYPHKFNYMTVITAENAERQYRMATRLIRYLQFIISVLFSYIVIKTVEDAYVKQSKLDIWFVFILEAAILVPTVYTVYTALTIKKSKVKNQNSSSE